MASKNRIRIVGLACTASVAVAGCGGASNRQATHQAPARTAPAAAPPTRKLVLLSSSTCAQWNTATVSEQAAEISSDYPNYGPAAVAQAIIYGCSHYQYMPGGGTAPNTIAGAAVEGGLQ